jgi:hypothetical protein
MFNKLLFNKGDETEVEIFTRHKFLLDIEETIPKPARHFLPTWWKDMPRTTDEINDFKGTAKSCPSFVQMFGQGIVLPMWCDTILSRDKENRFSWQTSTDLFKWEFHQDWQLLDYLNKPKFQKVFKAECPWFIRTKPGVSILQFPMLFDFNDDYTIMPGILNTDIYHQLNQQVIYTSQADKIKINRGQGFVWYIPFVRTKFDYKTFGADEELIEVVNNQAKAVFTKFSGHHAKEMKRRGI